MRVQHWREDYLFRKPDFTLIITPITHRKQLEGHELSYLRAIGVIILSAVLKRRMILADKAKSLFISKYASPAVQTACV